MNLTTAVTRLLRVLLVLLFAALVMAQTFSLPGQFAHMAQESPDFAYLRWPLTVVGVLEVLCFQVVVVCIWRLLTLVKADSIFSPAAFGWVDAIVWAITAAWVLLLGTSVALSTIIYTTPQLRDPGLPVLMFGLVLVGGVLVLLLVVLRALLRQAASLRTDLDAVI